jgi:hypothetical protein
VTTPQLPRLARVADSLVIALFIAAAAIAASGGLRTSVGVLHLSLTDPFRPLWLAAILIALRHWRVPSPSLVHRLRFRSDLRGDSALEGRTRPTPDLLTLDPRRSWQRRTLALVAILAIAFGTWQLVPSPGTDDINAYWTPWMHNVADRGVIDGYVASRSDYPLGTSMILSAAVAVQRAAHLSDFLALKLSILVFLCLTTLVFWLWTRHLTLSLLLHATLMVEALGLAYVDVFFAPAFIAALWALERGRVGWFGVFFTVSWLIKWQPVILLPVFAVWLAGIDSPRAWRRIDWRAVMEGTIGPAIALSGLALIAAGRPLAVALKSATTHVYFSGDALNVCWIITHWLRVYRPEAFGGLSGGLAGIIETRDPAYTLLPKSLLAIAFDWTLIEVFRRPKTFVNLLRWSLVAYLAYFTFNTGVHENHWFLAVLLAAALAARDRVHLVTAVGVAVFSVVNLVLFYGWDGTGNRLGRLVLGVDAALPLAMLVVVLFFVLSIAVARQTRPRHEASLATADPAPPRS